MIVPYTNVCHLRWTHFCLPRRIYPAIKKDFSKYSFYFVFKDAQYSFKNDVEKDWNKAGGLYMGFFNTRFDTIMMGWRYNNDLGCYEVCPYLHRKGSMERPVLETPESWIVSNIKSTDGVKFQIEPIYAQNKAKLTIFVNQKPQLQETIDFDFASYAQFYEIQPYFGGSKAAPRTVRFLASFCVCE